MCWGQAGRPQKAAAPWHKEEAVRFWDPRFLEDWFDRLSEENQARVYGTVSFLTMVAGLASLVVIVPRTIEVWKKVLK